MQRKRFVVAHDSSVARLYRSRYRPNESVVRRTHFTVSAYRAVNRTVRAADTDAAPAVEAARAPPVIGEAAGRYVHGEVEGGCRSVRWRPR